MNATRPDRDILEWDVRNWSKALDFWETHGPRDLSGLTVLDIGARRGGLSLWAALRGAQVVCSDLGGPDEGARRLHRTFGVEEHVRYADADVLDLPFPSDSFDAVMFKSVLGGVGHSNRFHLQRQACREMHRVLKPGGTLFFAENATASPLHGMLRQRFTAHGTRWRYVDLREMELLLAPFASWKLRSFGVLGLLGRSERQRAWLGHVDTLLEQALPERWNYALCGIAAK